MQKIFDPLVASQILRIHIDISKDARTDKLVWTPNLKVILLANPGRNFEARILVSFLVLMVLLSHGRSSGKRKILLQNIHVFQWRLMHNGVGVFQKIGRITEGIVTDCRFYYS